MRVDEQRDPRPGRPWSTPWWSRVAPAVLLLLVACVQFLHPVDDPDTWWHLRSGDELRVDPVMVGPDPWSPFTTHEWIRHQWLGEVLMSWVHSVAGLPGVAWLVACFAAVTAATAYAVARREAAVLVATGVTLLAVVGTSMTLSARPQSLSLPLTLVAASAWLGTARDHRVRWWLVPLTWIWAGIHGFWFLVPVVGVVVTLGLVLERAPGRVVARAGAATAACLGAAALTPVGPRLLTAPLEVSAITGLIEEWRPPEATAPAFLVAWGTAVLLVLLWSVGEPPHWAAVGVLVLASYLLVTHGRTVSLAVALLVPLVASAAQSRIPYERESVGRGEVLALGTAVLVGLGAAWALAAPRAAEPGGVPTGLSARLDALPAGTVVCNDYDLGGWLWWAHPDLVPVIDGRTELYGAADVEAYARFAAGTGTLEEVARRRCTSALLRPDGAAATALVSDGWALDGEAEGWAVLLPPG